MTEQHPSFVESTAKVISAIFHPLIIPAVAFYLLLFGDAVERFSDTLLYYGIALIFSVLFIPGYIWWLKRRGRVESMDIKVREQRLNPLLVGAASYFLGFMVLLALGAPAIVQGLMFCYATNTLLVVLITRWWKVSVHTTAIGGPIAALFFQFGSVVAPLLVLVPLVGGSRVVLRRHTVAQVLVGAIIGLGLTALQLAFFFSSNV
jgi:membrane-associated phospholipid phosphatase